MFSSEFRSVRVRKISWPSALLEGSWIVEWDTFPARFFGSITTSCSYLYSMPSPVTSTGVFFDLKALLIPDFNLWGTFKKIQTKISKNVNGNSKMKVTNLPYIASDFSYPYYPSQYWLLSCCFWDQQPQRRAVPCRPNQFAAAASLPFSKSSSWLSVFLKYNFQFFC